MMERFLEATDDDARRLLARLGSFWHFMFDGQDQLFALWRARTLQAEQLYLDFLEAYACAVFADIPVFHREHWSTLSLTESGLTAAPLRYGEAGVDYGGGYRYGASASQSLYWPLPADVKDIRFLHDNPLDPSVTLTGSVDYAVRDGTIVFYANPFADERLHPVELREAGVPVDRGLTFWCEHNFIDRRYLLAHLGAALKLYLPSSEAAKRAMVALANLYAAFPTRAALTAFLAAMVDAPAVVDDIETVEVILDKPRRQVVTDKRVYDIADGATIVVKPGDQLRVGDPLTDAALFYELAHRMPDAKELPAVVGGAALLVGPYQRELAFPNANSATWTENGRQRFTVLGDSGDVAAFWRGVDARGGLALTSRRVNPAQVVLSCLRGHGAFVRLNARSFGPNAAPALTLEFLRRALAPRLVLLSYLELAAEDDDIALVEPDAAVSIIRFIAVADDATVVATDGISAAGVAAC